MNASCQALVRLSPLCQCNNIDDNSDNKNSMSKHCINIFVISVDSWVRVVQSLYYLLVTLFLFMGVYLTHFNSPLFDSFAPSYEYRRPSAKFASETTNQKDFVPYKDVKKQPYSVMKSQDHWKEMQRMGGDNNVESTYKVSYSLISNHHRLLKPSIISVFHNLLRSAGCYWWRVNLNGNSIWICFLW